MSAFFRDIMSMQTPFNMVVLVVFFGCVAGVLSTIIHQIRRYACHRHDIELKREMIERGMSVDEIERIVRARSGVDNEDDE